LVLVSINCVYTAIQNRNVVGPGQGSRYFQRMTKGTPGDEVGFLLHQMLQCKILRFLDTHALHKVRGSFGFFGSEPTQTYGIYFNLFVVLFFSIEPVDIWNCEILLTASLDCTVRLWTMEGHFVGTCIRGC